MPRRIVFRRFGGTEVLEIDTYPTPEPGPGEIRVDVAFAGVNYADVIARRGFYKWAPGFPTCVGFELSGVVSAVGTGVTEHRVGDHVLAITRFGGYAEQVIVEARRAWRVPSGFGLDVAAALPAVYMTAWHSLREVARVRRGDSVLIQAVAGGVGIAALQIAKHLGLTTYGTASSPSKLEFAREHGLDHAIDYSKQDFEAEIARLTNKRGVDFVLDSLGGDGLKKGYRCLARGGLIVTIGAAGVAPAGRDPVSLLKSGIELVKGGIFHPFQLIEDNRGIAGVQVLLLWDDLDRLDRGLGELLDWLSKGIVKPHIDKVYPLERAAEAHTALESRTTRGKLLLSMK
ncbi:MAG: quinone oxidoreductase family protein [Polyangiales bacterium]